ncbi:hypothetical protein [uncultured Psychroserpens sp.]|uniref:hypothetical protein n=1 Tax=uncultured Psychroserpens sp. TaxID=255436 RepID=UPI00262E3C37|nr:hypothetical protein [uncultured Psychroserpens sp.]
MKHLYLLLLTCLLASCGNKRTLLLPQIENAEINELHDVSHAYLFYDETKEDSVDLNRKNLISTTNWLVNVDKRLTLEQAIPKIKFLQDKKRNAKMHKNEAAKNYFTCNDTSIKNLGFLEFTDTYYHTLSLNEYSKDNKELQNPMILFKVDTFNNYTIQKVTGQQQLSLVSETIDKAIEDLIRITDNNNNLVTYLKFNPKLSFQDYILIKSKLLKIESDLVVFDNNEFIY